MVKMSTVMKVAQEHAEDEEIISSNQWPPLKKAKIMAGERELTTGLLAKDASFRLIVSGEIGVKEIERLIKKLELDKEILADQDDRPSDDDIADANQRD